MVVADHYYGYYAYGWPLHSRQTLMVLLQWLWLLWSWLTTMVDHAMVMVDHTMVMVDHTMVMVDHYIHVKHWGINPSSKPQQYGIHAWLSDTKRQSAGRTLPNSLQLEARVCLNHSQYIDKNAKKHCPYLVISPSWLAASIGGTWGGGEMKQGVKTIARLLGDIKLVVSCWATRDKW